VEDAGGQVVESVPGLVRVVLADPPPPPPKKGSLFGLFRKAEPPPGPPPVPPVAIDLHLTRRDVLHQARLDVKAVFRAVDGPLPDDPRWHQRCQNLVAKLKAYLMA
jgi:serine/threonine-protein kinase